jgi:hypothetical protein
VTILREPATIDVMPYKNPEVQAEYQRQYVIRRRKEWIDAHGPCGGCGSWDDLEVDHRDATTKLLNPRGLWNLAYDNPVRINELAKCQVLCHPCHVKKTWESDRERAQHGTDTRYGKYKCRCDLCREARRIAKKANRERRKALGLPYH